MIIYPFVKLYKTPTHCYIFDVNKNSIVQISEKCFDFLDKGEDSNCCESEIHNLINNGYLSENRIQEIKHPETDNVEFLLDTSLSELVLQVTQTCNLGCIYCPYANSSNASKHRTHTSNRMNLQTAKSAVDFFVKHSVNNDQVTIAFYGGEPIIEFDLIKEIVCYSRDVFDGKELSFQMTTNATLLTDDIMRFLIENKFSITFSMDGPEEIHDKHRKKLDGTGTYDTVMDKLTQYYNSLPINERSKLMINMVINPNDDFDIISNWAATINDDIYLGSGLVENDDLENKFFIPSSYTEKFQYHMALELLDYLQIVDDVKTSRLTKATMKRIMETFKSFKKGSISLPLSGVPSGPCISGQHKLFVNVFGDFYPCEKVNEMSEFLKIGSLSKGFDYDSVKRHINIAQFTPEKCKNCYAQMHCDICQKYLPDGIDSVFKKKELCSDTQGSFDYFVKCCILIMECLTEFKGGK